MEQCFYKLEMCIERKRKKKCILFVGCILLGNNREGWGIAKTFPEVVSCFKIIPEN